MVTPPSFWCFHWIYYFQSKELQRRCLFIKKVSFSNRSSLDENEAFLTTADSAVKLVPDATKPVNGWKGLEYKASFPLPKPPGANFYPPDMDKMVMD